MTRVEKFKKIAEEITSLYEQKDKAYGDSFGSTYNKLGIISAVTRISDKTNRLCQLATNPDIDNLGESIEDTLKDLAAYCIMTLVARSPKDDIINPIHIDKSYSVDGVAGLKVDDTVMHHISDILEPRKRHIKEIIIHGPLIKILFWDMGWYCTMNVEDIKKHLIKEEDEKKV